MRDKLNNIVKVSYIGELKPYMGRIHKICIISILQKDEQNKRRKYTFTDKGYYIGENVKLGKDSYIEPGCIIGYDAYLGKILRLWREVLLADLLKLWGALFRGVNSGICNRIILGENCVIGRRATVTKSIKIEKMKTENPTKQLIK